MVSEHGDWREWIGLTTMIILLIATSPRKPSLMSPVHIALFLQGTPLAM